MNWCIFASASCASPLWLNEGLAVALEKGMTGEGCVSAFKATMQMQDLREMRAYWNEARIQGFWDGSSFNSIRGAGIQLPLGGNSSGEYLGGVSEFQRICERREPLRCRRSFCASNISGSAFRMWPRHFSERAIGRPKRSLPRPPIPKIQSFLAPAPVRRQARRKKRISSPAPAAWPRSTPRSHRGSARPIPFASRAFS